MEMMQDCLFKTGTHFQSQGAVSKQQLALLEEAQEAWHAAKATLGWSGLKSSDHGGSLTSQLDSLANFDTLKQLVNQRVRNQTLKCYDTFAECC